MEWIDTAQLLANLPVSKPMLRKYIRVDFLDGTTTPERIPLHQGVALAAAAQARSRGVDKPKRIYDLVVAAPDLYETHLLVIPGPSNGPARLVPIDGFEPVPAIVLELPDIAAAVRAGEPIPG